MDRRERMAAPVVGGSSLLVIFAVLCLSVFALLGLSTVQADRRLSQASAQAVFDYYQAQVEGEEILARLRQGEVPEGVRVDGRVYSYTCPVSDTKQLEVVAEETDGSWRVLRWQMVSLVEWEADESLDVWDGEPLV